MLKKIISAALTAAIAAAVIAAAVFADVSEQSKPPEEQFPETVSVYLSESGRIEQMSFDRFVEGCISGIIPVSGNIYEEQTLAAMAVIINTNALVALKNKSEFNTFGADFTVCDAFPYVSYTDRAVKLSDRKVIRSAIETAGHAYLSDGTKPVSVKMCAVSTGKTRDLPYMPSKEIPEDALAKGYFTERAFSEDEVLSAFSSLNLADKEPSEWFSEPIYDEYGSLVSIDFIGHKLSGEEICGALDLKSDSISVEYSFETFIFRCKGNGENAGMSLNAANIDAQNGKDFAEILAEFYDLELIRSETAS